MTIEEAIKTAIEYEKRVRDVYVEALDDATNPTARRVFQLMADEEHNQHVECIRQVHEFDKIITGLKQKKVSARKEKEEVSARLTADDIYERFKSGEKLSTEDLMALQKAGYL